MAEGVRGEETFGVRQAGRTQRRLAALRPESRAIEAAIANGEMKAGGFVTSLETSFYKGEFGSIDDVRGRAISMRLTILAVKAPANQRRRIDQTFSVAEQP